MRKSKLLFIGLTSIITLALSGCGSTTSTQDISFENFKMKIDSDFKKIDPTVVENKFISNKVVSAYKKTNKSGFDDNFMIGKTKITTDIDTDRFAQMITAKLEGQVYGASIIKTDSYSFKCGNDDIKGIYTIFSTPQNVSNTGNNLKNYFLQYYFLKSENGYIISFGTNDQKSTDTFLTQVKTLNCNQ